MVSTLYSIIKNNHDSVFLTIRVCLDVMMKAKSWRDPTPSFLNKSHTTLDGATLYRTISTVLTAFAFATVNSSYQWMISARIAETSVDKRRQAFWRLQNPDPTGHCSCQESLSFAGTNLESTCTQTRYIAYIMNRKCEPVQGSRNHLGMKDHAQVLHFVRDLLLGSVQFLQLHIYHRTV